MPWHKVVINPLSANDKIAEADTLMEKFVQAHTSAATRHGMAPRDMGMFASDDSGALPHHFYFTPATAVLAPAFLRLLSARPCDRPKEKVCFLAGDDNVRQQFYAGEI
jgi:hypothetical protein